MNSCFVGLIPKGEPGGFSFEQVPNGFSVTVEMVNILEYLVWSGDCKIFVEQDSKLYCLTLRDTGNFSYTNNSFKFNCQVIGDFEEV